MKPHGEKGVIEATVVTVSDGNVFFDVGQKIEGVMLASDLRDEKGIIEVKPGDVVQVSVGGRNEEGYLPAFADQGGPAERLVGAAESIRRKSSRFPASSPR